MQSRKSVSLNIDTYNKLKDVRKKLEKNGGKWTYDEIIRRALDCFSEKFKKEIWR